MRGCSCMALRGLIVASCSSAGLCVVCENESVSVCERVYVSV